MFGLVAGAQAAGLAEILLAVLIFVRARLMILGIARVTASALGKPEPTSLHGTPLLVQLADAPDSVRPP
ncbi:hypothetical protein [Nocardia niigatensis]|uniref:hypothetical protein n=1 Tax=Nocardia niigatensis TaxID=209249 RepID=UPI0002FFBB8A|nr:hypothetical protein [Nocardia niigatensis]